MARPDLHVVKGAPAHDPRQPEDMLGFLFARERQLQAELADVRAQLDVHRIRYSKAHNLRVFAGIDTLRGLFGPKKQS